MTLHQVTVNRSQLNASQWRFLQSRARVSLLCGGFGSGKTTGLALKGLQLKAENGTAPGLVVSQTYRSLWSVTVPRLLSVCKRAGLNPQISDKMGACYLDFGDLSPVFLRSATDPALIDGLDVGWALGDEIRHWPRETFEVFLGRVRVNCARSQIALASTPAMHWMAEEFHFRTDPSRELITAPTAENERNLSPGFIDNLRLSYSLRMQRAVIDGQFTILEGSVYEALDPNFWASPHAVDFQYNPSRKTYLAIDPGYRRSAYLFAQETGPCEWTFFDQLNPDNATDWATVQAVNAKGYRVDEIWCDPAADSTQSSIGLDTIAMLKGITTRSPSPIRYITGPFRSIKFGVDKLRTMLGGGTLPIRFKFAKSLEATERGKERGLVKSLLAYAYPEMRDGRPVSDEPLKDGIHDHSCDAARYLAVGLWLTTPSLKALDAKLLSMTQGTQGFKAA